MHFHRGELIFTWECNVGELRVQDPATAEQHGLKDKGFSATNEIRLDRLRVVDDGEVRFETSGASPRHVSEAVHHDDWLSEHGPGS